MTDLFVAVLAAARETVTITTPYFAPDPPLIADGSLGLVGSANMDRRSLDLNFENNILFDSTDLAERVAAHQRAWLADAIEIDHGGIAARSLPRRFVDNLLTMIAAVF